MLLTGRLPALFGAGTSGLTSAAASTKREKSFGVLCTDYTGLVSGCRITAGERSEA